MAETVIEIPMAVPIKKARTSRKALKEKSSSTNKANILAGQISESSPAPVPTPSEDAGKENHESLSQPLSGKKKTKGAQKGKKSKESQSFERDLQEMQEKLGQLRLEKEKTEGLLKARDEMLKIKEEELETRGREQEKLQMELKKLQKLKEFKPTVTFPLHSLRDKEQEKKEKNKKRTAQKRKGHLRRMYSAARISGMRPRKQTRMQTSRRSQKFWGLNGRQSAQKRRSQMRRNIRLRRKPICR